MCGRMEEFAIYVGGLSFDTDEKGLRKAFDVFGEIKSCNVVVDRETGQPRGFGFVTFVNAKAASNAIKDMDGQVAPPLLPPTWISQSPVACTFSSAFPLIVRPQTGKHTHIFTNTQTHTRTHTHAHTHTRAHTQTHASQAVAGNRTFLCARLCWTHSPSASSQSHAHTCATTLRYTARPSPLFHLLFLLPCTLTVVEGAAEPFHDHRLLNLRQLSSGHWQEHRRG
eukprot:jgi/Mesen1/7757/ME000408S06872